MRSKTTKLPELKLEQLLELPYPVASWQLPNSVRRTIVSLQNQKSFEEWDKIEPGFLVNKFIDNHPISPTYISADIIISESDQKISATISDTALDLFLENLDNMLENEPGREMNVPSNSRNEDYEQQVEDAISEIRRGRLQKVVVARYKDRPLPKGFSITGFFNRVCEEYPNSFCSLISIPDQGVWIGASPELLISENSDTFQTVSLAGTKKLNDQHLSEIAWTQKEIEEQAFVSRYIINCFKKIRLREFSEHGPKTNQAGNLVHLKTEYSVDLSNVQFDSLGEQMLTLLHPTSAVCGMPLEASQKFIKNNEGFDREFYAGFLGPINFEGETNLFVNLRCTKINNGVARLFAGAGITEDSIPRKEFEETDLKMSVLEKLLD